MTKRYLITSALPYINGAKHLGNLIGSLLPADVFARFLRQAGYETLYICGTDEHGTPAEIAAQEANLPVEEYCKKMYELQKEIYEKFCIEFDFFGRSSAPSNHNLTTEIFKALYKNDYIVEKYINQYYSFADNRFLPDRYVEGTCFKCGYEKARGDQCDGCSELLNPEDLQEPYSVISKSKDLVLQKTKHFFLNLPKLENKISEWINEQNNWSEIVRGIAKKWLKDGLLERCITRDLSWGIKVPFDWLKEQTKLKEFTSLEEENISFVKEKVFYVWFDAPNAYISLTQDWANSIGKPDSWKRWWCTDQAKDVFYAQFMAKDNVPFHAVFWPAILIGSDLNFKMVDDIKGFHWLTYEGGKFSTSQKRGVFTDVALDIFPCDYWRYYLLATCPESSDFDFSFQSFASIINKDLADILGNFINRVIILFKKYFSLKTTHELQDLEIDKELLKKAQLLTKEISISLYNRKFRQAISALRSLWVCGNEYITCQEPWKIIKNDLRAGEKILLHCLHLLRIFAIACYPFIPNIAKQIYSLLSLDINELYKTPIEFCVDFQFLKKDHILQDSACLFEKITDEKVKELTFKFSGN